ncbi:dTDP-4-dehydrorhamnose 3,5-epimerase [Nocardioides sp. Iso805N]|uniref:dTDP-4-dehydrorhamnose 3,5-epimerase n=1 Tax=Nocardioides sp. Iso805N TaxID=1283287 RepID=UPI00037B877D|nr:dTDP-4-dehydrorhamnose 3,5-epimerase [Nocardioides sp. Iso805N]
MYAETTAIPGLVTFTPEPHHDARGFFSRTFDTTVARSVGVDPDGFVQDSMSRSARGVVRGLHLRVGAGEGKLVRCSSGAVFDVVVDLRPASPAYGTWLSFDLSGERQNSIFVPPGCAHGFQALTEVADTSYRIDRSHDPSEDLTIAYDDPTLAIPWPLPVSVMSDNDRAAPPLAELGERLALVAARIPQRVGAPLG